MTRTPEKICLLHGEGDNGETLWCDHVPDDGMEATVYIRADIHNKRVEELLRSNNELLERARKAEAKGE